MGKLNRAVIVSVAFCLSISLLFSSCKDTPIEYTLSSEVTSNVDSNTEAEKTSPSSSITNQTEDDSTSNETKEFEFPYDLSVQIISSSRNGDSTVLNYKKTVQFLIDTCEGKAPFDAVDKVLEEMNASGDNTWDFIIFTHPDQDHIENAPGMIDYIKKSGFKIDTIIDFGVELEQESLYEKGLLRKYKDSINALENINYYTPNGVLSKEKLTKEFVVDSHFKLTVLYNEASEKVRKPEDDNELSVCCLFTIGEQKLLFTGDLENGEIALYKNHRQLLRNVTFFKAGHHGSDSSNSKEFIDWIKPAYVAISYNSQITGIANSINNFLKYTDYIFPTVVKSYGEPATLFGNCEFEFNGRLVKVTSEVNDKRTIRDAVIREVNDDCWFEQLSKEYNITDEVNTYFFDENTFINEKSLNDNENGLVVNSNPGNLSYYNCTLVKYGHFDIIIDCGSINTESKVLVDKLKDYVVDGVIEYVIVSHYHLSNYSQLIGSQTFDQGVFKRFKVEHVIDNDSSMTNCENISGTAYSIYLNKVQAAEERISLNNDELKEIKINNDLKLTVYRGNNSKQQNNEDDYSLVSVIDFNGRKMVFVGDLTNYTWFNNNYAKSLGEIYLLRFPSSYVEFNKMHDFDVFLKTTKPKVIVIGSPINHWNNGQYFIKGTSVKSLITFLENSSGKRTVEVYTSGYVKNNINMSVFGDIDYTLFKGKKIVDKEYEYYVSCRLKMGNNREISYKAQSELHTNYYMFVPNTIREFPTMK